MQAKVDEAKAERRCRLRDMHEATVVACAESLKRRFRFRVSDAKWKALRPFYDALHHNIKKWESAHQEDQCSECAWHLARCICRALCRNCGQSLPRRAWAAVEHVFPKRDVCQCEKLDNALLAAMRRF